MHGRGLTAVIGASLLLGLAGGSPTRAQGELFEDEKLVLAPAAERGLLGHALSASGKRMVAALAREAPGRSSDRGRVLVYRRSGGRWTEEQRLAPLDGFDFGFGENVAMQGERIVVGSVARANYRGGAYVFQRIGPSWETVDLLLPSDSAPWDGFGADVALDGDVIAVGRTRQTDGQTAIYVFRHDGSDWVEEQIIDEPGPSSTGFGWRFALSGDHLIVAEEHRGAGRALIYRHDGQSWILDQELHASDPQLFDQFGSSVDIEDDVAVVGARLRGPGGSAVIFRRDASGIWNEVIEISHPALSQLGASIDLDGGRLLIGAQGEFGELGGALLYRDTGSGWVEQAVLRPSDGLVTDQFGRAVALTGSHAIVASPFADGHEQDVGAVYTRDFADLSLVAEPEDAAAGDDLRFTTRGALPASKGMLFLVEVDGIPSVQSLFVGAADAEGHWSFGHVVPPGLSGLAYGFQAIGYTQVGEVGASRVTEVRFQ